MTDDQIEAIVAQAHRLFGETSIFEVFDLEDRKEVLRTLVDFYGPVETGKVDKYMDIINKLRN